MILVVIFNGFQYLNHFLPQQYLNHFFIVHQEVYITKLIISCKRCLIINNLLIVVRNRTVGLNLLVKRK